MEEEGLVKVWQRAREMHPSLSPAAWMACSMLFSSMFMWYVSKWMVTLSMPTSPINSLAWAIQFGTPSIPCDQRHDANCQDVHRGQNFGDTELRRLDSTEIKVKRGSVAAEWNRDAHVLTCWAVLRMLVSYLLTTSSPYSMP